MDFAQGIFDDFIELHGDRNFRDDGAIIGGIGRLNGQAVTVVGIQKMVETYKITSTVTLGQPHPEGYRKALRLMKQAEKVWSSSRYLYQYCRCLSWCWSRGTWTR